MQEKVEIGGTDRGIYRDLGLAHIVLSSFPFFFVEFHLFFFFIDSLASMRFHVPIAKMGELSAWQYLSYLVRLLEHVSSCWPGPSTLDSCIYSILRGLVEALVTTQRPTTFIRSNPQSSTNTLLEMFVPDSLMLEMIVTALAPQM